MDVHVCSAHVAMLFFTDSGLLCVQAPGHEVLLEVGAEKPGRRASVVARPFFHLVFQPGHPLKSDSILQLWEVLLKDQSNDPLGPYGT